jgi:protein KTI12
MALITVSGYPCSGKTTRVHQIKDYFEQKLSAPDYDGPKFSVIVVDDEACNIGREVYDSQ